MSFLRILQELFLCDGIFMFISPVLPFDKNDKVFSINKKVTECCNSSKEGASKLMNKLYYAHEKNKINGIHEIIFSLETLSEQLDRSVDSLQRYIRVNVDAELLIVEKVRDRFHKVRYKFILTEKFLNIKKCGTVAKDKPKQDCVKSVPNFYTQNPQVAAKIPQVAENTLYNNIYKNTGLNSACAPKTFLPTASLEKQPLQTEAEVIEVQTPEPKPSEFTAEAAIQAVEEIINPSLETPLVIDKPKFRNAFAKRAKRYFGTGSTGLENWRKFLEKIVNTPFMMGRKLMKDGKSFTLSVGTLLSGKIIEHSWNNKGFFEVYPPKEPKQQPKTTQEKDEMGRKAKPQPLPELTLEEALNQGISDYDKRTKANLFTSFGEAKYKSWIHNTGFVAIGIKDNQPQFSISSQFARDHILTHYGEQIKQAFVQAEGEN
jgi:hypothetical protein